MKLIYGFDLKKLNSIMNSFLKTIIWFTFNAICLKHSFSKRLCTNYYGIILKQSKQIEKISVAYVSYNIFRKIRSESKLYAYLLMIFCDGETGQTGKQKEI